MSIYSSAARNSFALLFFLLFAIPLQLAQAQAQKPRSVTKKRSARQMTLRSPL
jgi:hypothetical protein